MIIVPIEIGVGAMKIYRLFIQSAFLVFPLRLVSVVGIGGLRSDYSQSRDIVSALGAIDAPYASLFNVTNFYLVGVLTILFAVSFYRVYKPDRFVLISASLLIINGAGYTIAGALPCDPECPSENLSRTMEIHILFGVLAMFSGVLPPVIFGFRVVKIEKRDNLAKISLAFGIFGIVAFVILGLPWLYYPNGGLIQKIVIFTADLWIFTTAYFLLRNIKMESARKI